MVFPKNLKKAHLSAVSSDAPTCIVVKKWGDLIGKSMGEISPRPCQTLGTEASLLCSRDRDHC